MLHTEIKEEFERDVWCLLGLPFDIVKMGDVIGKLYRSSRENKPLLLSTPNLTFLIASQDDSDFRNTVINSNLSVVDGKPLVWVARLLSIPIPERVAGSDLIEELIKNDARNNALKVFFFGGEEGIAEAACKKLNYCDVGLKCVGSHNPGFGSVEGMSTSEIINKINQCNADFIIVSLGAKKGQAWSEKNLKKLNGAIVGHLGAVVNFIAGTVNRSPKILSNLGLEWLWRIKEEPLLWKRYFNDAIYFFYLILFKILPLFVIIQTIGKVYKNNKSSIDISTDANTMKIELDGYWGGDNIMKINKTFQDVVNTHTENEVEISISNGSYVDAAFMAKILILKNILLDNNRILIINTKSTFIKRIFRYNCCEYLLRQ